MSRRNKRIENILNNPSTPPSSEHINSSHDINNSENNSSEINSSKKKGNKRKKTEDISTQGRWTDYEHKRFVEGKISKTFSVIFLHFYIFHLI